MRGKIVTIIVCMLMLSTVAGSIPSTNTSTKPSENETEPSEMDYSHNILGEFFTLTTCQPCKYSHRALIYIYENKIISNMKKIIDLIGDRLILKGSEEEMKLLAGDCEDFGKIMTHCAKFYNNGIYIMTLGEKGSMLTKKGEKILKIPAFKPRRVIDETGAGDIYFSIFLYEFIRSDKSWEAVKNAAYLASAAASFLVEKRGPAGFETKKRVLKRVKKRKYVN